MRTHKEIEYLIFILICYFLDNLLFLKYINNLLFGKYIVVYIIPGPFVLHIFF